MANIAINLLPVEFTESEIKRAKFYKVQAVGIAVILAMVFLSSLSVALRILQSQNMKGIQNQVSASEQKIQQLKSKQVSLLILKNRLTTIDKYLSFPSKQTENFKLLDRLIPASISISSVNVDKSGSITILGLVPDSTVLGNLIDNLTDKEKNGNLIKQVSIDTLSRGRDSLYRVSLTIKSS